MNQTNTYSFSFLSVCSFLLLLVGAGWFTGMSSEIVAQEEMTENTSMNNRYFGLDYGSLKIKPSLEEEFEYDSNIFLRDHDERHDFILRTKPGIDLEFQQGNWTVTGGYQASIPEYVRLGKVEDTDHTANLNARYDFGKHFYAGVDFSVDESNSPAELTLTDILTIFQRDYAGYVGYDRGPFHATIRYTDSVYEVDQVFDGLDYDEHRFNGSFEYDLRDNLTLRSSLEEGHQTFESNSDEFREATVGAYWKPTDRLGMIVDVGYRQDHYKTGSDYESFVLHATGMYQPWENGNFTVGLDRNPGDSSLTNFVTRHKLSVDYEHRLSENWDLQANGSYTYEKEDDSAGVPQDSKYHHKLGVSATRKLTDYSDLKFGYQFQNKLTDDGNGEYEAHSVTVSANIRF